jgi:hypothetical protein
MEVFKTVSTQGSPGCRYQSSLYNSRASLIETMPVGVLYCCHASVQRYPGWGLLYFWDSSFVRCIAMDERHSIILSPEGFRLEKDFAGEAQQQLKTTYPSPCQRGRPDEQTYNSLKIIVRN